MQLEMCKHRAIEDIQWFLKLKKKEEEEEETAQHVTFDINECFQLEPVRLGRCLLYFWNGLYKPTGEVVCLVLPSSDSYQV